MMPAHTLPCDWWRDGTLRLSPFKHKENGREGRGFKARWASNERKDSHSNGMDLNSLVIGCLDGYGPADARDPRPPARSTQHQYYYYLLHKFNKLLFLSQCLSTLSWQHFRNTLFPSCVWMFMMWLVILSHFSSLSRGAEPEFPTQYKW